MKLKTIVYRTKNNQSIISLPSSIMEKYEVSGELDFRIKDQSFSSKIVRDIKLNKNGSTTVRGVITIPKQVSDNLGLLNKQEIEIIIMLE